MRRLFWLIWLICSCGTKCGPEAAGRFLRARVDDAGVTLVDNGMRFESKNLAGHLQGCQKAAVLAATLGSNADTVLRRLALTNVAQAAAAQAVWRGSDRKLL